MKRLYPIVSTLGLFPVSAYCALSGDLRGGLKRRFWPEKIRRDPSTGSGGRLWIHAASAGEVRLANLFAETYLKAEPGSEFLLTTNTDSGLDAASAWPWNHVRLFPFDAYPALRKLFCEFKPAAVVTVEMELWPGLFEMARKRNAPVAVVNARMSEDTAKRYAAFQRRFGDILTNPVYMARSDRDLGNLLEAGVPMDRIWVTGEMKVDLIARTIDKDIMSAKRGRMLLAVSTHRGEDEIILDAFEQLHNIYSDITLVIAPRHTRRATRVEGLASSRGWVAGKAGAAEPDDLGWADVIVEDGLGRMARWYKKACIAFVGGSLVDAGGHNVLEPILYELPVITGPNNGNWAEWVNLLDVSGSLSIVADASDIARITATVIEEAEEVTRIVRYAKSRIEQQLGASERNARMVKSLIAGEEL